MKKYFLVSIIIMLVVFTAGCGNKIVEKSIENNLGQKINGDVDLTDNGFKMETEQGTLQAGENTKLPEDFPKDVSIIEGKLLTAYKDKANDGFVVSIETNKDVSEVKKFYKENLENNGWQIVLDLSQEDVVSFMGQKDQQTIMVGAEKKDDKVIVTLIVGKKMY